MGIRFSQFGQHGFMNIIRCADPEDQSYLGQKTRMENQLYSLLK
ncbi:hypothetical protein [Leptospira noguchii]|nr:hypothetical protein [Leptospira noguchii]